MPTENRDERPWLLIAGASVRAAAASALRAGFRPWCVDLFADADLARACPVRAVSPARYPGAVPAVLAEGPPGPWLYTGALENHPELLSRVDRPLWGNPPDVVRAARDPQHVEAALKAAGLNVPRLGPWDSVRQLVKPRRGAAGGGIRFHAAGTEVSPGEYVQEWIDGEPASALFLGRADGTSELLGASRQLIGTSWLHVPRPFQYAGSIGPLEPSTAERQALEAMGHTLTKTFRLRGLFGADLVRRGDGAWPVEINPRYTASVEILERSSGRPYLRDHAAVFAPASPAGGASIPRGCHGKAILFAREDGRMPADGPWKESLRLPLESFDVAFADLPAPGQPFLRGQPILTFFARGRSPDDCECELRKIAADLDRALYGR